MANYNDCKKIQISDLYDQKGNLMTGTVTLTWSGPFTKEIENSVALSMTEDSSRIEIGYMRDISGEHQRYIYKILLTSAQAHFGGSRPYFICPLQTLLGKPCLNRVSVLYKPNDQDYFGCRHCYKILYATQMFNQRSKFYSSIKNKVLERKIDRLEDRARSMYYRGQKTKRQTRLEGLRSELTKYPSVF